MRTPTGTLILLLLAMEGHTNTLFDQLRAFNPYWQQHQAALDGMDAKVIRNDVDHVQAHLAEVLRILADAPTSDLTRDQSDARNELIAVLADYARQGRFPINYYREERIPVFIDEHGTHCAVGHLMRHTGHEALARRIAAADNYAWVREINDPELAAWQWASGFSLDELKLIQGAYDFYFEDAFLLPEKYEVPQKPEQVVRYFEGADSKKIWCYGEGANGEVHGHWEQNYSATLPWIVGYFEHGKRSGRWKEYYKGTDKLCRTEHWRDDKLNGVRTRYDRDGQVIETILFKDGQAVTKTNFDHEKALRWVRSPIDPATVHTEVFTTEGALIAAGNERIHNPAGLSWFQNIELTALNTYAITARDGAPRPEDGIRMPRFDLGMDQHQIPGQYTLVEYRKEGEWAYYKDYLDLSESGSDTTGPEKRFARGYVHFGAELFAPIASYDHLQLTASYDSMHVVYHEDRMADLFGFAPDKHDHLQLTYYPPSPRLRPHRGGMSFEDRSTPGPVQQIARLDQQGNLIGTRVSYDRRGQAMREERFLVPYKKDDEMLGVVAE